MTSKTVLLALAAVALGAPATAQAAQYDNLLLSRAGLSGPLGNAMAGELDVSADGRYVAYESWATNLVAGSSDIGGLFVRDTHTGATVLASRADGPHGTPAGLASNEPSISADGRYVAFSTSSQLVPGASGQQVYVRDLVEGTTTLVSRATGAAGAAADAPAGAPAVSADGRYVAFASGAENLGAGTTGTTDVWLRDLTRQTTTLVSRATGANGSPANQGAFSPSISDDGRLVAFASYASNLGADIDQNHLFVRDVRAGTTALVSRDAGGAPFSSFTGELSGDGSAIAMTENGGAGRVVVRDLATGAVEVASRANDGTEAGGSRVAVSADGRRVAFTTNATLDPADTDGFLRDVYVRDLDAHATALVSRGSGAAGPDTSLTVNFPGISADGRYVGFVTKAPEPHPDANGVDQAYLRDVRGPAPEPPAQPGPAGPAGPTGSAGPAGPKGDPAPAGAATPLFAVLSEPQVRAKRGRTVRVGYFAGEAADVVLEIRRGRRVVARVAARARAGRNALAWRARGVKPGSYALVLTAVAAGRSATDTARLKLTR